MKKIIFLGDSITDAEHCFSENPLGNGYVDMVDKKLNHSTGGGKKYDIVNCGHDGFTIQGVKRMLEHDCILRQPDIICMAPFIFPYPRKYANWIPGIRQAEAIEKRIAERYHVEFLELQDLMISAAGRAGYENITTDGIHLTEGGNEIIAGELMRFLADN